MDGNHRSLRTKFLPLFVQRRWRKVCITSGRLMKFSRCVSHKRKIPPMQRSDDFVGWIGGKMNRMCCGAVDLSGIIHGEAVFKMNTTTSCGWVWTNPQNQWNLQGKYHGMLNTSRGFWKFIAVKREKYDASCEYRKNWLGIGLYSCSRDGHRQIWW